jgi:hypothetical protein
MLKYFIDLDPHLRHDEHCIAFDIFRITHATAQYATEKSLAVLLLGRSMRMFYDLPEARRKTSSRLKDEG